MYRSIRSRSRATAPVRARHLCSNDPGGRLPVFSNVFYEITATLLVASASVLVLDELRKLLSRLVN